MSLKNIDIDSALRRIADRRIEEAMREGKFDNLSGKGEPLDLDPLPADETVRMTWWALRIMKQNDFTRDEIRWRKSLDVLREQLFKVQDESKLPLLTGRINELVHKINTLGTNAVNLAVTPVDLEEERARLRARND